MDLGNDVVNWASGYKDDDDSPAVFEKMLSPDGAANTFSVTYGHTHATQYATCGSLCPILYVRKGILTVLALHAGGSITTRSQAPNSSKSARVLSVTHPHLRVALVA